MLQVAAIRRGATAAAIVALAAATGCADQGDMANSRTPWRTARR